MPWSKNCHFTPPSQPPSESHTRTIIPGFGLHFSHPLLVTQELPKQLDRFIFAASLLHLNTLPIPRKFGRGIPNGCLSRIEMPYIADIRQVQGPAASETDATRARKQYLPPKEYFRRCVSHKNGNNGDSRNSHEAGPALSSWAHCCPSCRPSCRPQPSPAHQQCQEPESAHRLSSPAT